MVHFNTQNRLASALTNVATAALVAGMMFSVSPISAQTPADARWQAYTGCWEPLDGPAAVGVSATNTTGSMVCVVPATSGRTVQIASISNGKVVHVDQLVANGERVQKAVDGCKGWESALWSKDGHRVFIRSEFNCGDSVVVKGSTVYSISGDGNWVHAQGNSVGANSDARVTQFKLSELALAPDMVLADSAVVRTIPADRPFSDRIVRLGAAEPTTADDILELARNTDKQVAQTWVAQFAKPAKLTGKELVALADAGMPPELIDIMIAQANPERYALQANNAGSDGPRPTNADIARANGMNQNCMGFSSRMLGYRGYYGSIYNNLYNSAFDCPLGYNMGFYGMNMYGLGFGNGYGFGNYFYGNQPIVIVTRGDGGEAPPQGRAVRGQGYTRDKSTTSSSPSGSSSPRTTIDRPSGSSSSGSSSSGSSGGVGGASSGGASTGRTAVPKTPPPSN